MAGALREGTTEDTRGTRSEDKEERSSMQGQMKRPLRRRTENRETGQERQAEMVTLMGEKEKGGVGEEDRSRTE